MNNSQILQSMVRIGKKPLLFGRFFSSHSAGYLRWGQDDMISLSEAYSQAGQTGERMLFSVPASSVGAIESSGYIMIFTINGQRFQVDFSFGLAQLRTGIGTLKQSDVDEAADKANLPVWKERLTARGVSFA